MQPTKKKENFRHKYTVKVKLNEVDILQIVNNAVYFNYFEQARIQYAKDAGLITSLSIYNESNVYYLIHNEINYINVSRFDDELNIFTRVSYIKNSSFGFEHLIENSVTKKIIAEGTGVSVHVNPLTGKSTPLTDEFIEKIMTIEPSVEVLRQ